MMKKMQMSGVSVVLSVAGACAAENGPESAPAPVAAEASRSVDCPALTRVKYPFLSCVEDAAGNVVFDAAPVRIEGSQMPELDPFVENAS